MRIQHNIMAMSAYRNFVGNNNALSKNLEKLSSGYRINRAGDDAAGLAISEKMRAQITGLDAAQKNVKDGISLVKTAEGAMQEVQDMLNRMKYLATQSANGTYQDNVDRENLQKEVDALKTEINRIADSANFNGQKLLDGSMSTSLVDKDALAAELMSGSAVDGQAPTAATKATMESATAKAVTAQKLAAVVTNGTASTGADTAIYTLKFTADGNSIKIGDTTLTAGTSTLEDLGNIELDDRGTKISDLFNVSHDSVAAFDSSKTIDGTKDIVLTAKNTGDLGDAVENTFANAAGNAAFSGTSAFTAVAGGASAQATLTIKLAEGESVKVGNYTITQNTTYDELMAMDIGGTLSTVMGQGASITKDGNPVTDTSKAIGAGAQIVITAVTNGAQTAFKTAADAATKVGAKLDDAVVMTAEGKDVGAAGAGGKAKMTVTIDPTKVKGGETFTFGPEGKEVTFRFTANPAIANASQDENGAYYINLGDKADATVDANFQAALEKAFGADYTIKNNSAAADTTSAFEIEAKQGGSQWNLGDVRYDGSTAGGVAGSAITLGTDAVGTGKGTYATATYNVRAEDLTAGAVLKFANGAGTGTAVTINIVADDDSRADTVDTNTYYLSASKVSEEGLTNALEKAGFTYDNISWDGKKLTVTDLTAPAANIAAASGNALATALGDVELTPGAGNSVTTGIGYSSLYTKTFEVDGATYKVGDFFDMTVTTSNGTVSKITETSGQAAAAGDTISYVAKTNGAMDEEILQAAAAAVNATYTNGVNEGSSDNSGKTTYSLNLDMEKVAGGQSFTLNGKTYELSVDGKQSVKGSVVVDLSEYANDLKANAKNVLNDIVNTIKTTDSAVASNFEITNDGTGAISMTANKVTTDTNFGKITISHTDKEGFENAITASYTASMGVAPPTKGVAASNTYAMDRANMKVGDTITIGDATVEIVEDGKEDAAAGKFSLSSATDDAKMNAYFANKLSGADVKFDGDKVTVASDKVGTMTAKEHAEEFAVSTSAVRDTQTKAGGLTLQIGDTADSYNQLTVAISDMHTKSLGIDDLDISNLESAQAAIEKITNAINSVSSTRGDLGAIQNRLEHTTNNLSVMEENITDAESTIRDTDMADEMTAYTKNNILVQAAQAMLAQANQLPQGVLQLLQ